MVLWIESLIPEYFINFLTPIALIAVGHAVEKNFVGRITCFANAIAVNIFIYGMSVSPILVWYANIG
ncbi:MAG: hypothetical protein ACOCQX_00820 [Candidatus Nanoarchaeia archaeon]